MEDISVIMSKCHHHISLLIFVHDKNNYTLSYSAQIGDMCVYIFCMRDVGRWHNSRSFDIQVCVIENEMELNSKVRKEKGFTEYQ